MGFQIRVRKIIAVPSVAEDLKMRFNRISLEPEMLPFEPMGQNRD